MLHKRHLTINRIITPILALGMTGSVIVNRLVSKSNQVKKCRKSTKFFEKEGFHIFPHEPALKLTNDTLKSIKDMSNVALINKLQLF